VAGTSIRPGTLATLRVLDVSDSVAGQFAARVLADYGAEVYLAEPRHGSSVRQLAPFDPRAKAPDNSLLFFHLNTLKRPLPLDWREPDGRARLSALAADADIVVTDDRALATELSRQHSHLVACAIADFAPEGPYAAWYGCEMVHQALGGLMYMTGREGEEPLFGFGHRASYSAGAAAAASVMAAILERQASGRGQVVSLDLHETAASMCQHLVLQYAYNGSFPGRGNYPTGGVDIFRCSDGWAVLYCRSDRWVAFCNAFGAAHLAHKAEYAPASFAPNWPKAHREISPYLAALPVAEVIARAQEVRVIAAKVMSMADVLACEHLAARDYWDTITQPEGARTVLGPLFRLAPDDRRHLTAAPRLADVSTANDPPHRTTAPRRSKAGTKRRGMPLAGVRVIEMATAWAGPMLGRILAHLGAEVIKIESTAVTDSFRGNPKGGSPTQYPDGDPGVRPFNRAVPFNAQNLGKTSLNLDLKTEGSREVLQRLVKTTDAVVCNFSPRAMRGLGLDYDSLRAIKKDIILLELPAAGSGGPLSDIAGVGHTMEALAGVTGLQGYADGAPQRTGPAYLDPIGAFNGTIALCLALYDRRSSGHGRRIELAQREAAMQWLGEFLLLCSRTGAIPSPRGNQIDEAAPHGAFRAQGEDAWIAIGAFSDTEWGELCVELGDPALAQDPRFASRAERIRRADIIRPLIEKRTRERDKHELAAALQRRGVHAAPVATGKDVHDDPQLAANGFFLDVSHPEAGRHRHHGLPFHFSATLTAPQRHAPLLGEHTDRVLRDLGYDEETIARLKERGVVAQAEAQTETGKSLGGVRAGAA
jgi:crotonobetainyl-CoA:carnitine CoA-transferase CaiB-like acyl-CoA transferase